MQCVILAAGKGTRLLPITKTVPKPLVEILGKPIIDHIIEALPREITDLIVVVGYKGEDLQAHLGTSYENKNIVYVEQKELLGTAAALNLCKNILKDKFLIMPADDIHGGKALQELVLNGSAIAVSPSKHPERFGVVVTNENGFLTEIVEKSNTPPSNLVSTGAMVLNTDIFNYTGPLHESGEYYLTDMITDYSKKHKVKIVTQDLWIPIGYPDDIILAENQLRLPQQTLSSPHMKHVN